MSASVNPPEAGIAAPVFRDYIIIGYDVGGREFTRMQVRAATAGIEDIRADAALMLFDHSGQPPVSFEVTSPEREAACNSHAALVEALENAKLVYDQQAERARARIETCNPENRSHWMGEADCWEAYSAEASAALAAAKQGGGS